MKKYPHTTGQWSMGSYASPEIHQGISTGKAGKLLLWGSHVRPHWIKLWKSDKNMNFIYVASCLCPLEPIPVASTKIQL